MAEYSIQLKRKIHDYAIAAMVVAGFASLIWLFATARDPALESPLTSLKDLRNVIVVQDQAVGSNVVISYAALSDPSYVVISQALPGEERILAVSRLLPEGEAHTFRVPVEGGLPAGRYLASLRRDDGNGRFEPERDTTASGQDGARAVTSFVVSDAPPR